MIGPQHQLDNSPVLTEDETSLYYCYMARKLQISTVLTTHLAGECAQLLHCRGQGQWTEVRPE